MEYFLSAISAAITLYSILCFINILLSWFPGSKFTGFGRFISRLCDPYLNFFSRISFLHIANVDFSPILSISILIVLSSIFGNISASGRIYFGGILGSVIYMIWNVASSILVIFLLLVFIRWIVLFIKKGYIPYDSGWNNIDRFLQNFSYKIAGTFIKNNMSYLKSLLVTWIALAVFLGAGNFLIQILMRLCFRMPF